MDWETIKFFVLMAIGGLLWVIGWFFGKDSSVKPPQKPDTKPQEEEAQNGVNKAGDLVENAEGKEEISNGHSENADGYLEEAGNIKKEIDGNKQEEKDLPAAVNHDDKTPEELADIWRDRGYSD